MFRLLGVFHKQQERSFQGPISFDERETIGDVQSDLARATEGTTIAQRFREKGWTAEGEGWRRAEERERDKGNPERQGYIVPGRLILYSV